MKRLLSLLLCAMMILTFVNVAAAQEQKDWKWERAVELVCPWGVGGGADTSLRALALSLEKVLGVPCVITNKSGGSGIIGTEYVLSQPADGYMYFLASDSLLIAQFSGATKLDFTTDIVPICKINQDVNMIVTRADAPYNTYEEMMAYIESNPNKVKCGVMSVVGYDGVVVKVALEGKVKAIGYNEGSMLYADVLGGHIDLAVAGPSEVIGLVESGDMKVILSCTEERLPLEGFSQAQSAGELGIDCYYASCRSMYCKPGTPEEAIAAFEEACRVAVESSEYQSWLSSQMLNLRPEWAGREEFTAFWLETAAKLKPMIEELMVTAQ